MTAASRSIFKSCLSLLMIISSVLCACASASPPAATTQPAEPPCCQKQPSPQHHSPAERSPGHETCPHCSGNLTADAQPPASTHHLADLPVLAIALISSLDGLLPLNTRLLSSVLDTPIAPPAALPARLHCALIL